MKPELKRAVALVRKGKSFGEAANAVGPTRNAVAGACFRAGVKSKNPPYPHDGEQTKRAVALYKSGMRVKDIAHALGHKSAQKHGAGGVYNLLRCAGVKANRAPRWTKGART